MSEELSSGSWLAMWETLRISVSSVTGMIFNSENITNWKFWVFMYLSFSIASHMELSPPDIKGAVSGLLTFVIFLLIFNLLIMTTEALSFQTIFGSYWELIKIETYSRYINAFLGILSTLFIYALIISGINFILSYIVLIIYNLIKKRRFFNPFWI